MADAVAVRGVVATRPRHVVPEVGAPVTTFRLVTRPDGVEGTDGRHNWYTVTATHRLALSAAACVARGDPVVVAGRLRVRDWEGEPVGVTAEIEAQAIGHDLAWGNSVFTRFVEEAALTRHGPSRGEHAAAGP
ncbi:single-stranded DNA-binding protein [uncultured Leifsonia sp.]|uniref:single-stranded DNA-binding protein n=1 Tax=uncultured Leifsonia sp. TaxID=340359 RepID=UPI0025D96832|nr:single-stranded DNA-binding protein [uncultured Leifsonia sp.]